MKRVGVYVYRARVDIEGIIQAHLDKLQNYVNEHGGTVADQYVDIGYDGRKKCRVDFRRMLQDCKDGKLDEVLILRTRHLSGKAQEFLKMYHQITDAKVALSIVEDPIDEKTFALLEAIEDWRKKRKLSQKELVYEGYKALLNERGPNKTE